MKKKTLWIIFITMCLTAFSVSLVTLYYQAIVAWRLRWTDEHLQINTHFKTDDVTAWFMPHRSLLTATRFAETALQETTPTPVELTALFACCVAPRTLVKDFQALCPPAKRWHSGTEIRLDASSMSQELKKALKNGTLIDDSGKAIKTVDSLTQQLDEEYAILSHAYHYLHPYRHWSSIYCYLEYPQQWLFTSLRLSYYIRYVPQWILRFANSSLRFMTDMHIPELMQKAKEQTKQNTWWLFHGHVDRKIDRLFNQLKTKVNEHGYFHDYWPFYHCLLQSFDLEIKNVYSEIGRLMRRNRELVACSALLK